MNSKRALYIYLLIFCFTLVVIPKINLNLLPIDETSTFRISIFSMDRPPIETELRITAIVENSLSKINGIKSISSESGTNYSTVTLSFAGKKSGENRLQIINTIRNIRKELPPDASYPLINNNSGFTTKEPLLIYDVISPLSLDILKDIVKKEVYQTLSNVKGIESIQVTGFDGKMIKVKLREDLLIKFKLTKDNIINIINRNNQIISLGSIPVSPSEIRFFVINNPLNTIHNLGNLKVIDNIRLIDISYISIEKEDSYNITRINGQNRIGLSVFVNNDVNRIKLSNEIKEKLNPSSQNYSLLLIREDAAYLKSQLNNSFTKIGIVLFFLTLVVSIYFRNIKILATLLSSLIGIISVSIVIIYFLNLTINPYSLVALIIGLEISIEQIILIIDNLRNRTNTKAFNALFTSSIIVLIIVWSTNFLSPEQNSILKNFGIILTIVISSSVLTNLFLTPILFKLITKDKLYHSTFLQNEGINEGILLVFIKSRKVLFPILILTFGLPIFLIPNQSNQPIFNKTFGSDLFTYKIKPIASIILGGTWRGFYENSYQKSQDIDLRETKLIVSASLEYGHLFYQTDDLMKIFEKFLSKHKSINYLTTISSPENAQIEITFGPNLEKTSFPNFLKDELTSLSLKFSGIKWNIMGIGKGFSNFDGDMAPSYKLLVKGYDYQSLEEQCLKIKSLLEENERIHQINTNAPVYQNTKYLNTVSLEINGQSPYFNSKYNRQLLDNIQTESKSTSSQLSIFLNSKRYPLQLESENSNNFNISDLLESSIYQMEIPLKIKSFSKITTVTSTSSIIKEEREYVKSITFDYYGSEIFGDKYLKDFIEETNNILPIGYKCIDLKNIEKVESTEGHVLIIIILFSMSLLICAIYFESFSKSILVLALTPFPFIGNFTMFQLYKIPFDQGALFSFLFVAALSISSIIYIMNYMFSATTNNEIIKVIKVRGMMILVNMTTLIASLVPIIYLDQGTNEFWQSFGIGVVGGAPIVIFTTLFILPLALLKENKIKI